MAQVQDGGKQPRSHTTQTMTFRFPGSVKQVDDNAITVEVDTGDFPLLSDHARTQIMQTLGEREGDRFIDEMTFKINRELILRSVV